MIYKKRKTIHVTIAFILLLMIFLTLSAFVEIPLQISSYAEVFPKERWLLIRGNSGQIISDLIDFTEGHTAQYNISQFERGEYVAANFTDYLNKKKILSKGDTVVAMQSSNVQDQLVTSEGELKIAIANLKSQNSAQKAPLIKEAEEKLKYTSEKISEQKVLFERVKQLFEKKFCSQQEYEQQKWSLDLLKIEEKIYSAQIENLETGVKTEEVKLLESQVDAIEKRLKFLKNREDQLVILSPIHGRIISSFSPDTLLHITNYDQVVLHTPIKLLDLQEFKEGQIIPVYFSNVDKVINGQVLKINKEVKIIDGQQVVFISVLFENSSTQLLPGMVVENSFKLGTTTLFNQLIRLVTR
jgi:hypothetical protein